MKLEIVDRLLDRLTGTEIAQLAYGPSWVDGIRMVIIAGLPFLETYVVLGTVIAIKRKNLPCNSNGGAIGNQLGRQSGLAGAGTPCNSDHEVTFLVAIHLTRADLHVHVMQGYELSNQSDVKILPVLYILLHRWMGCIDPKSDERFAEGPVSLEFLLLKA